MGKLITVLLISFVLMGCETTTRAKVVKVPIIICPVPEHSPIPVLAIDALVEADKGNWEKIAKSYAASIVRLEADNKKLRAQLEVYRSGNGEVIDGITDK